MSVQATIESPQRGNLQNNGIGQNESLSGQLEGRLVTPVTDVKEWSPLKKGLIAAAIVAAVVFATCVIVAAIVGGLGTPLVAVPIFAGAALVMSLIFGWGVFEESRFQSNRHNTQEDISENTETEPLNRDAYTQTSSV